MREQWNELKETIIELRDNNGTCTQQEVCQFLANLMNVLEAQMEPAADVVEVVRCKDCKHRPYEDEEGAIYQPDWCDFTCPFLCEDSYYNGMPEDDFFCKRGERREDE